MGDVTVGLVEQISKGCARATELEDILKQKLMETADVRKALAKEYAALEELFMSAGCTKITLQGGTVYELSYKTHVKPNSNDDDLETAVNWVESVGAGDCVTRKSMPVINLTRLKKFVNDNGVDIDSAPACMHWYREPQVIMY